MSRISHFASDIANSKFNILFVYSYFMQILDVKNAVVVVSRWFGGILLGGDRFKLINNAARDALELGTFIASSKASPSSDDGTKKKGKKR